MADLDRCYAHATVSSCAVSGDGRTAALVAGDGSLGWLPATAFDAAPAFAVFAGVFPQSLSRLALTGAASALAAPLGRDRQPNVMIAERR